MFKPLETEWGLVEWEIVSDRFRVHIRPQGVTLKYWLSLPMSYLIEKYGSIEEGVKQESRALFYG
jgi:hypothetical protein